MQATFEEKYVFVHTPGQAAIIEHLDELDNDYLSFMFRLAKAMGYLKPRMNWTEIRRVDWENYTHKTYRIDVSVG
jgi:hypothetical protein